MSEETIKLVDEFNKLWLLNRTGQDPHNEYLYMGIFFQIKKRLRLGI